MYNRYIPQSDGSYQRNRIPDKARMQNQSQRPQEPRRPAHSPCTQPCPAPPCRDQPETNTAAGIGRWLRNLLPKDFDTEDLLVIILFLLMSKDREDQNSALLTLALYLFM